METKLDKCAKMVGSDNITDITMIVRTEVIFNMQPNHQYEISEHFINCKNIKEANNMINDINKACKRD